MCEWPRKRFALPVVKLVTQETVRPSNPCRGSGAGHIFPCLGFTSVVQETVFPSKHRTVVQEKVSQLPPYPPTIPRGPLAPRPHPHPILVECEQHTCIASSCSGPCREYRWTVGPVGKGLQGVRVSHQPIEAERCNPLPSGGWPVAHDVPQVALA